LELYSNSTLSYLIGYELGIDELGDESSNEMKYELIDSSLRVGEDHKDIHLIHSLISLITKWSLNRNTNR
jgi:hypothetical protein